MPGLADPGYELISTALERGIPVVPVAGPTALAAALAVAGIPAERFIFLGFLPRKKGQRRALLASVADSPFALVAYESPHRLVDALTDLSGLVGQRTIAVACELTKMYEDVQRGSAEQVLAQFQAQKPRGEYTLVVAPPATGDSSEAA
jgi:16S rRNA (cytidine1402-2'-O)-methyltransferase